MGREIASLVYHARDTAKPYIALSNGDVCANAVNLTPKEAKVIRDWLNELPLDEIIARETTKEA